MEGLGFRVFLGFGRFKRFGLGFVGISYVGT